MSDVPLAGDEKLWALLESQPVVVAGVAPGRGRDAVADRVADRWSSGTGGPVCRLDQVGSLEPDVVTLLRLLDLLGVWPVDLAEAVAVWPEWPVGLVRAVSARPGDLHGPVVNTCAQELDEWAEREKPVLVVVDGARASLLHALEQAVGTSGCRVLALVGADEPLAPQVMRVVVRPLTTAAGPVAGARERLTPEAVRLCDALAALTASDDLWLPDVLIRHLTSDTGAPDDDAVAFGAAALLKDLGLLEQTESGVRLHRDVVKDIVDGLPGEETRHRAAEAAGRLMRAARSSPALVGEHPTTCLLLAVRSLHAGTPGAEDFAAYLAEELAHRGNLPHLLGLREAAVATVGTYAVYTEYRALLGLALRRCGENMPFNGVMAAESDDPALVLQHAQAFRERGMLGNAELLLARLPSERGADGWVLHTKAGVACERGDLRGVGPLLRRAIEAHQVVGDLRGEAWAVLEYGRWCLLRGDPDEAEKRVTAARTMFGDIDDAFGKDWADVELLHIALVRSETDVLVAEETISSALAEERPVRDRRAAAWRELYLTLLGARGLPLRPWMATRLRRRFIRAGDRLGLAWLDREFPTPDDGDAADTVHRAGPRRAAYAFAGTGCSHAEGWALLRLGNRVHGEQRAEWLAEARDLFDSIGDEAGKAWADVCRAALDGTVPPSSALRELSRRYPPAVLALIEWPQGRGPLGIPRVARLTVPEPRHDGRFRFPTLESRIRLTLLDDAPAADRVSRIALHLVPGMHHPWSSAPRDALPWLSAHAVPVTAADVQPEHSVTIRPSAAGDPDAGAEFRFTPLRPGHHLIRFTVTYQETGTVLQEVETEIDIIDSRRDGHPSATAPLVEPLRVR